MSTVGRWLPEETPYHINCLVLLEVSLAIMSVTKNKAKAPVLLLMDNISAVTYINKMGGTHSSMLSYLAKNLWDWCRTHNISVTAQNVQNVECTECRSGQGIESISRLQRLETASRGFQPPPSEVESPEHRPLCLPSLLPTRSVCKLASRPSSNSHRCIHPGLGDLSRAMPFLHLL